MDLDFGDFAPAAAAPPPSLPQQAMGALPALPPLSPQEDVFGVRGAAPFPPPTAPADDVDMAVIGALSLVSSGLDRISGVVAAVHAALGVGGGGAGGGPPPLPADYRREAATRLAVCDELLTRGLVRLDGLPKTPATSGARKEEVRRANALAEGVEVARAVLRSLADVPPPAAAPAPPPRLAPPAGGPALVPAPGAVFPPASALLRAPAPAAPVPLPAGAPDADDFGDFSAPPAPAPAPAPTMLSWGAPAPLPAPLPFAAQPAAPAHGGGGAAQGPLMPPFAAGGPAHDPFAQLTGEDDDGFGDFSAGGAPAAAPPAQPPLPLQPPSLPPHVEAELAAAVGVLAAVAVAARELADGVDATAPQGSGDRPSLLAAVAARLAAGGALREAVGRVAALAATSPVARSRLARPASECLSALAGAGVARGAPGGGAQLDALLAQLGGVAG